MCGTCSQLAPGGKNLTLSDCLVRHKRRSPPDESASDDISPLGSQTPTSGQDDFGCPEQLNIITTNEVKAHLKDRPEAQQLEWLRLQIEMRVLGLGWSKFATRWSSQADSRIGTLAHLKMLLVDEILPEEAAQRRLKRLPTEAAPPQNLKREHGTLGTIDADAAVIERRALFSMDELKLKAEAATQRRVAAGITDDVENLQPQRPAFDQELVGKWL